MFTLRMVFEAMGSTSVRTLLNSGNVTFDTDRADLGTLERDIEPHPDLRLYVTFLRSGERITTVVDLRDSHTIKAIEDLERRFGKDLTTRNWNTV